MKNNILKLFFLLTGSALSAQSQPNTIDEMKLNLNEGGSHYIKATFLNQVWIRYNQSNAGTTVLGDAANETFDIGLRRTRIQFFGQLTDHVFFYSQFGQNNFNYLAGQNSTNSGNRKVQVFFHDALGEYKVWKDNENLKLGAGLTITNGLSRFSQPSIGTIMTMDVPVFAQSTVDQIDEFARKLSLYARGQIGKLDYRIALSDPFPITTTGTVPPPAGGFATFAHDAHTKQFTGFFMFNFFESEPHTTPYMTGTYLGKKKIFNLEAGFITQKNATWTSEDGFTNTYHDLNQWAVALYYDAPLNEESGNALSAYLGYFDLDYGPGYLRYNGIMNPATGIENGPAVGSHGNAFPMFGTGNVLYAQAGYLFKNNLLGNAGTLLPYLSWMSAGYDRLMDQMNVYAIGINWLLKGHSSKFSLDYQNRPVYEDQGGGLTRSDRKGQLIFQYQISF
jgi:hypothetical protein